MSEVRFIRHVAAERVATKIGGSGKKDKVLPSSPIGVFDSGVGGLTVLREIFRQLPHEDIIYLADTARIPYGGRSPEEIITINREIIPFLLSAGAKMIVMACGTSSAIAYPVVKDEFPVSIVNLIDPGSHAAVAASRSGRIGVIATIGTVNSQAYQKKIKALNRDAQVFAAPCPLFVPLIEGGFIDGDETKKVAKEYLKPLLKEDIDTLVLGCTHYPHLNRVLRSITGPDVVFVDPAEEAVMDTKQMLKKAGTLKAAGRAKYEYFVTGSAGHFEELGSRLLGKPIAEAKQIKLG